jgi:RNA polymerase sigma-70 factor (ECF subfamily)
MGRVEPELLLADSSFSQPSAPASAAQEAALIQRAQRGDREAFNAIMDLYRERVVRMAFHMVGNPEDAQDLCQETFVKVYRSLGSFDRKRAFSPWLYRIAHNVVLDFLRRKKVRPALMEPDPDHPLEEDPDPQAETPQEALLSKEMRREVMQAIQSLPENYRSVVVFRFLDELSYAEIADALDLTESNVMMRMSRARRMLRDKLKHLHSEESLS